MAIHLKSLLLLSAILFLFEITPGRADFYGFGRCPAPTRVTNAALNGDWFEQRRYDSLFSHSLRCVRYRFTPNTGALNALNIRAIYKLTGREFNLNARLIPTPTGSTNNYAVQYNTPNLLTQSFQVIGFEANVYVVLYSCINYGFFYSAQVVVLTRAQVPAATDVNNAINVVRTANLPVILLRTTDQSFC